MDQVHSLCCPLHVMTECVWLEFKVCCKALWQCDHPGVVVELAWKYFSYDRKFKLLGTQLEVWVLEWLSRNMGEILECLEYPGTWGRSWMPLPVMGEFAPITPVLHPYCRVFHSVVYCYRRTQCFAFPRVQCVIWLYKDSRNCFWGSKHLQVLTQILWSSSSGMGPESQTFHGFSWETW